mmetsp:Transcript_2178/g.5528  ORF Transcript_2178/g.5528 Transcript_2178/m.5528 type:complete len:263 (+) Transcript_2178:311-1099(+)
MVKTTTIAPTARPRASRSSWGESRRGRAMPRWQRRWPTAAPRSSSAPTTWCRLLSPTGWRRASGCSGRARARRCSRGSWRCPPTARSRRGTASLGWSRASRPGAWWLTGCLPSWRRRPAPRRTRGRGSSRWPRTGASRGCWGTLSSPTRSRSCPPFSPSAATRSPRSAPPLRALSRRARSVFAPRGCGTSSRCCSGSWRIGAPHGSPRWPCCSAWSRGCRRRRDRWEGRCRGWSPRCARRSTTPSPRCAPRPRASSGALGSG